MVPEDIPKAQRTLQEIKGKIRALGSVNVGAVEEYKEVSERYEYMSGQISDIEESKAELVKLIDELTGKMAERFREQFRRINNNFTETFKDLFDGGKAELVLDDPQDVLECNINIRVQPRARMCRISTCSRAAKRVCLQLRCCLRYSRSRPHRSASLTRSRLRWTMSTSHATPNMSEA